MHPPSRARRILKWTGIGLSLLILAIWVASLRWYFNWNARRQIFILGGICRLEFHARSQAEFDSRTRSWPKSVPKPKAVTIAAVPPASSATHQFGFRLPLAHTRYWKNGAFYSWAVQIPLWIPLLLSAIPTAWMWHHDRRRILPGHCSRCGYDLTGNTSGTCSECGERRPITVGPNARGSIEANG